MDRLRKRRRLFWRTAAASAVLHVVVLGYFGDHVPLAYPVAEVDPEAIDVEMFQPPQEPPPEPPPQPSVLRRLDTPPQPRTDAPADVPAQAETPVEPLPTPEPPVEAAPDRVLQAEAPPAPATVTRESPIVRSARPAPVLSARPAPPSIEPYTPPAPVVERTYSAPAAPTPATVAPQPQAPRPRKVKKLDEDGPLQQVEPLNMAPIPAAPPSAGGGAQGGPPPTGASGEDGFNVRGDGARSGASLPGGEGGLRGALRRSGVGCANADAVKLTKEERLKCLDRIPKAVDGLSPLTGIDKDKLRQWDATAERRDRARTTWENIGKRPGVMNDRFGRELDPSRPMPTKTNPSGELPDHP